jgi:transposase
MLIKTLLNKIERSSRSFMAPSASCWLAARFHIMRKFNEAIDEIRRGEVKQFKANGQEDVLERKRWLLLKRPENLSEKQTAHSSSST